jgi:alpha-1,4-digalacturonate transport system permease protein
VASALEQSCVVAFLTRTRGRQRLHWTDWLSYGYLLLGLLLMFGPVLWLALSSFKTQAQLLEFPPGLLPYGQVSAEVPGHDQPLVPSGPTVAS